MIWLALIAMASAAFQAPNGAALSDGKSSIKVTQVLMRFGECVARSRIKDIERFLKTDYGSQEELDELLLVARTDMDCDLSGERQIQVSRLVLTGSILEAYYHRVLEPQERLLQPVKSGWMILPDEAKASEAERRGVKIVNLGACLASRDPDGVRHLMRTMPSTSGELESLKALRPQLLECSSSIDAVSSTQQELRAAAATGIVNRLLQRSSLRRDDQSETN